jgi:hypothetical protein
VMHDDSPHIDRRTWLTSCARVAALGGMAAAAGLLGARGQFGSCPYASPACAACGRLPYCGLPSASAVRDSQSPREKI